MCGIAGVLNAVYQKDSGCFIRDSMVAGMLRGVDSTGVMQMDRGGKIYVHKEAVPGAYFLSSKITQQFVDDVCKSPINVVHTRAATQGVINKDNAHPFIVHKPNKHPLVGVHNGSLYAGWKTRVSAKGFEVDSHWALTMIAEHGIDAFRQIHGPFCFVWTDAEHKGKLFIARNSGRPMHVVFSEGRKSMYFASEAGMLHWLTERNNIKTETDILVLAPERLYEFDTTGSTVTYTSKILPFNSATTTTTTGTNVVAVNNAATDPARNVGQGPSTGALSYVNAVDSGPNQAGKDFIERIKLAAKGKDPYNNPSVPITNDKVVDDVVSAIVNSAVKNAAPEKEEEVVRQRDDDAPFQLAENTDLVPTTWFDARSTKKAEREYAVTLGFFRELQWFRGVAWDDDSGECLGDVEIWDKKNGKQTYTGVIRNISRARAHAEYIDNKRAAIAEGFWVVITGAYVHKQLGTVFVLSELNMLGKQAVSDQHKKAH